MLVKIEARILIFPGTDFHFPSTFVPLGTFLGSAARCSPCPSRPVLNVLLTMRQGRSVHAVNSRRSCTVAGVWPSQICCTEWPSLFAEGTVWSWVHTAVDRLRAVAKYQLSPIDQFSTYCLVESRVPVNPGDDICGEISYKQRWWILSRFSIFNET